MAENEAPTMTPPGQAARATYPAFEPTIARGFAPGGASTPTTQLPMAEPVEMPSAMPSAMPWAMPPAPVTPARGATPVVTDGLPMTGVPANAAPLAASGPKVEWLDSGHPDSARFESAHGESPRGDLMNRLRTPMMGALAGGILVFAVGFGAGFVVGKDNAGAAASTGVQDGTGLTPDGGTGFVPGQGFAPGQGQGQSQGGFGGSTTTTGLSSSQ